MSKSKRNKSVESKAQTSTIPMPKIEATVGLNLKESSKYDGNHYLGLKLLNDETWQNLADNFTLRFPREIFDSYNYGSPSSKRFRSKIQGSHTIPFDKVGFFDMGEFRLDLNKFMSKDSMDKWFKLSETVCIIRIQTNATKCRYLIFNPIKVKAELDALTSMKEVEKVKAGITQTKKTKAEPIKTETK